MGPAGTAQSEVILSGAHQVQFVSTIIFYKRLTFVNRIVVQIFNA